MSGAEPKNTVSGGEPKNTVSGAEPKNIARFVLGAMLVDQHRTAISDPDRSVTRGEALRWVQRRARELRESGVSPDDYVVVLGGRGIGFWIDLLALWVIGAKPVALEEDVAEDHGANVLRLTTARFVCGSAVPSALVGLAQLETSEPAYGSGDTSVSSLLDFEFVDADRQPPQAGLIFTSGTTGLPKGVPLTHEQLVMNASATRNRLRLRESDRLMIATPFRFISSISHFIVTIMSGAEFHGVESKMMAKDLLARINEAGVTAFGGSPFHMHFIALAGADRLPTLRWVMSSGDHLPVETIDALDTNFEELTLHVVYGMAEMGGRICTLPPTAIGRKKGSVGHPIDGITLTVYDEGERAAAGVVGDVVVDGCFRFEGYLDAPDVNRSVISDRGFHTGDKGYLDDDGYLYLSGRSDSVFKRSGLKVSAQVIADAIRGLGLCSDLHVTSEEDVLQGRVPVAYLQPAQELPSDQELQRLLRAELPANHIPARFVRVPTIPRTGSGKVDRRALAELVSDNNRDRP